MPLSLLLIIISLTSCTSTVNIMKPLGEDCLVKTDDRRETAGELLTADSTEVILLRDRKLIKVELDDIYEIYVRKFSLQKEKTAGFVPAIIIDLMVGIPLMRHSTGAGAIFLGHAALSVAAIKLSNPQVSFKQPFSADKLKQLKLYARYPQGLSSEQWEELLSFYTQDNFENGSHRMIQEAGVQGEFMGE